MKALLFAVLLTFASPAWGHSSFHGAPLGYSCEQVQWAFRHFSQAHLMKMAKTLNVTITPSQRRQALNCLRGTDVTRG